MLQRYSLIVILLAHVTLTASTLSDDCIVKRRTVTCQQTIPTELPDNTTEVNIKNWFQVITDNTFNHRSWSSVEKLDITVLNKELHSTHFGPYNLQSLSNLQYLGYHSPNLGSVRYPTTFTGVNKLRTLDLADCSQDIVGSLMRTLNTKGILPVLDTIILDRTDTLFAGKPFELDKTFSDVLHFKKIKHLSLSGTYFLIKDMQVLIRTFALESFNISYAFGIFTTSDHKLKKEVLNHLSKDLKTLDVNYYRIGSQADHLTSHTDLTPADCNSESVQMDYLFGIENLYANGLNIASVVKSYADISKCFVSWKVLHAARNKLEELDISITWPTTISLYELDISYNKMKYLSPTAFSGVHSMKNLFLSGNRLSLMASTPEFSELFQTFQLLEHVTLANNGLSNIPLNMFEKNIYMNIIDLSGNELTSVTFETKQFKALKHLDLSSNNIYIIDANTRPRLDNLMNTDDRYIDLSGNAFQCSCESQDSITWLVAFQAMNNVSFTCKFEETLIGLDNTALDESQYQCHKTIILVATIAASVAGLLVISLLTFLTVRIIINHQRKDDVKRFIKNYRHQNILESFLVMLSYSSQDGDFVLEYIYPMLEHHLRDRVQVVKDIVCIDDKHFRPGRTIVEEMMDHIRDSCIVVFVVSISFCERQWCRQEVEEAYTRGKPVILLFLEEVDLAIMPAHLRDLFDRYTRTKLVVDDDGQYHLKPSWPLLCQSILELASQKSPP